MLLISEIATVWSGVYTTNWFLYSEHVWSFLSVVVITCALHAQGRRFEPGRKHCVFFVITICLADEIKDIRGHTGVLFSFFVSYHTTIWKIRFDNTILDSLVVRISACHVEGPGSIPGRGESFFPPVINIKICKIELLRMWGCTITDRWVWNGDAVDRTLGLSHVKLTLYHRATFDNCFLLLGLPNEEWKANSLGLL